MFHRSRKKDPLRDQRFTLPSTVEACAEFTEVRKFDLDVAACRESFLGTTYMTGQEGGVSGLVERWHGHVWCNPPWSDLKPWVAKAWAEFEAGNVLSISMLLPVRTEQPFWQELIEPFRDIDGRLSTHFLAKRQRFGSPEDPQGLKAGSPPFSCVLVFWDGRKA